MGFQLLGFYYTVLYGAFFLASWSFKGSRSLRTMACSLGFRDFGVRNVAICKSKVLPFAGVESLQASVEHFGVP